MRLTENELRRVIRKILQEASEQMPHAEDYENYDDYAREMRKYQKPDREALAAREAESAEAREAERREEELSIHRRHFDKMSQQRKRYPQGRE